MTNLFQVKCPKPDSRKGGLLAEPELFPLFKTISELDVLKHEPCYSIGATIIATSDRD